MEHDGWQLSPAYDITPISSFDRTVFLEVGRYGTAATLKNAVSRSEIFGLSHEDAVHICSQMQEQVKSSWEDVFLRAGVPKNEIVRLADCFGAKDGTLVESPKQKEEP